MLNDIPERNVPGLVYHIIRSCKESSDPVPGRRKGISLGNKTREWFVLYYSDSMAPLHRERIRIKHYMWNRDDSVPVHESEEYLNEMPARMREKVEQPEPVFNQKTQLILISEGRRGFSGGPVLPDQHREGGSQVSNLEQKMMEKETEGVTGGIPHRGEKLRPDQAE